MKSKITSIILAVLMVVGMFPFTVIPASAEEQEPEYLSETIVFNNSNTAESEHFTLTAGRYDSDGWYGGNSEHTIAITITPKNNEKLLIRNIEAVVGYYGEYFSRVGVSSGTKRETGEVNKGTTVHIDGVNEYSFSFSGGSDSPQFKDITVFYEPHEHMPTLISAKEVTETEHGISTSYYYCAGCGMYFSDAECTNRISKATVDSYTVHNWSAWSQGDAKGHTRTCICTGCGATDTATHTGYIDDERCDVCGYSGILAETIVFNNSDTAESEHFTLTANRCDSKGWYGGGNGESITITTKKGEKLLIGNIEAVIGYYGSYYRYVGVSSGTKRETGGMENGTTVHVDGVNAVSFSFADGNDYVPFKDITVFYKTHTHTPATISAREVTETEHGISTSYYYCEECGTYFSDAECTNELTKATVDSYIVHNWAVLAAGAKEHNCTCTCTGCGAQSTVHTGHINDGVCDVCGYSGVFAETIVFNNSTTAESEHFTLTTGQVDERGWHGGGDGEYITVTPKNDEKLIIKNIEAVVSFWGVTYSGVGVSSGTKREIGNVSNGATVHIDGVNAASFSFVTSGSSYSQFKDITVYFCASDTYEEILSAKAAIDEAAGANPSKPVKRIADGAKADIDNAITVAEIIAIRDECIADIEKLVHNHTFSTEWSFNETVHWHESTCGHDEFTKNMAAHIFDEDGKCTVCGYEKTAVEKKYTVILTGISNPDKNYSGATDDNGICNIENIENGTYLMAISCEGAVTRTYTTEITDSTITQDIELHENGDVNGDGEINEYDYQQAVNVALSGETKVAKDLSDDADYMVAVADFDGDGYVDVLDVVMIERKIKHITA